MPACAATTRGDQRICSLCGLQWDLSDPEPPACGRIDGSKWPVLKPAEAKALKQCAADWQPKRRRGAGYGRKGEPKIPFHVAKVLVTFHLAFVSQYQSLRATPFGEQWLEAHGKR
jgi:hypothetical protein